MRSITKPICGNPFSVNLLISCVGVNLHTYGMQYLYSGNPKLCEQHTYESSGYVQCKQFLAHSSFTGSPFLTPLLRISASDNPVLYACIAQTHTRRIYYNLLHLPIKVVC